MADAIYPLVLPKLMLGAIDFVNDSIVLALLDSGYTYSASHEYIDHVTAQTSIIASGALGSKTVTSGVFDAADETIAMSADIIHAMVLYQDNGSGPFVSPLIQYWDDASGLFPLSVEAANNVFTFSSSGIFGIL